MLTVRISRKKWSRGEGEYCINYLLLKRDNGSKTGKEGNMCCLGFHCLAAGLTPEQIAGHFMPSDTGIKIDGLTEVNTEFDSAFAERAAEINDDADLTSRERERELRYLAEEYGFKYVFVP
jgi:hypothetical protein